MRADYGPGNEIFERCLMLVIGDRPTCRLGDALEAALPAGVKKYMLTETVALLESDLASSPRLGRLLGGADPVGRTRAAILQGMAPLYEFTREEFCALLQAALTFTERTLVCPLETMERDLIAGRETVTLEAVRSHFARTADYGYLPRLAEEIFRRRGIREMKGEDFRKLMEKIDDQVVLQHAAPELALLMKPIFDFYLCRDAGRDDAISLEPILSCLNDRKMTITREYIESIARLRDLRTVTMNQLAAYLQDLHTDEVHPSPGEVHAGEELVASPAASQPEVPPDASHISPPPIARSIDSPSPVAEPDPTQNPPPATEDGTDNAPFLPDLRKLIGEKERVRFVKHVFQRDQAYFYGVVATLNTFWTWKEASAYLQQVYSVNRLDPFERDVVAFTDLVHRRYAGGETTG